MFSDGSYGDFSGGAFGNCITIKFAFKRRNVVIQRTCDGSYSGLKLFRTEVIQD